MRPATALLAALVASPAAAVTLPSGLEATLHDAAVEVQPDGERWYVLRYLAPSIGGGGLAYEAVVPDLEHLCETDGLAALAAGPAGGGVDQIVVVLMDRAVPRGVPDPTATQFIGAYLPTAGGCEWY